MATVANTASGSHPSLALLFQEPITVILRIRHPRQNSTDPNFRKNAKGTIRTAVEAARSHGYSNEASRMAMYAVIAFLDESVLRSRDPAFAEWARQPLQVEIFGDALAGEKVFQDIQDVLSRVESREIADILELHAICLMLGFRGRYALGRDDDVQFFIKRIKDKIARIRGPMSLPTPSVIPDVRARRTSDRWTRILAISIVLLMILCGCVYIGYRLSLSNQALSAVSNSH